MAELKTRSLASVARQQCRSDIFIERKTLATLAVGLIDEALDMFETELRNIRSEGKLRAAALAVTCSTARVKGVAQDFYLHSSCAICHRRNPTW
ncbi:hypothetical protein [Mesorhizobium sp. M0965]|uniref:hypothetical protein n=1 Tax=unclassified Mesorhizobium TaxID=325217 RepID=UPI00333A2865